MARAVVGVIEDAECLTSSNTVVSWAVVLLCVTAYMYDVNTTRVRVRAARDTFLAFYTNHHLRASFASRMNRDILETQYVYPAMTADPNADAANIAKLLFFAASFSIPFVVASQYKCRNPARVWYTNGNERVNFAG